MSPINDLNFLIYKTSYFLDKSCYYFDTTNTIFFPFERRSASSLKL